MNLIGRVTLVLFMMGTLVSEALAGECPALMASVDVYDRLMSEAIDDEPEDLPKELHRYGRALASGDTAQAARIRGKIEKAFAAMQSVKPPIEVSKLHSGLVDYYGAGVAVIAAREQDDQAAQHAAEIETFVGLKQYFVNVRDVFAEHGCGEGEVEAINEHYLPRLDQHIEAMRNGAPAPARY
jgi:hypothetical protein